ncbi:MAG: hypothetical protein TREMPRED_003633, partial [Tremellales sp. Tagirdzhanova-0007]
MQVLACLRVTPGFPSCQELRTQFLASSGVGNISTRYRRLAQLIVDTLETSGISVLSDSERSSAHRSLGPRRPTQSNVAERIWSTPVGTRRLLLSVPRAVTYDGPPRVTVVPQPIGLPVDAKELGERNFQSSDTAFTLTNRASRRVRHASSNFSLGAICLGGLQETRSEKPIGRERKVVDGGNRTSRWWETDMMWCWKTKGLDEIKATSGSVLLTDNPIVRRLAPTGVAAFNIAGATYHSALGLAPMTGKDGDMLSESRLASLQEDWKGT